MTTMTLAPANGGFAHNPYYALGTADAYDEYMAGETVDHLVRRSDEMIDAEYRSIAAELYMIGYANAVRGLVNGRRANTAAQTNVAYADAAETELAHVDLLVGAL